MSYGPDSIEVLPGLEAVRRRPGMYVGDTSDGSGLHHLLWELVANSIDEHLARWARRLRVDVSPAWIAVEDDGRGIPVAVHEKSGKNALELVLTTLHAGPTWDGHFPHVHVAPSMHGVGLAAVNALCERLEVEVRRDGKAYRASFERGVVIDAPHCVGNTGATGTLIRFRPDPTIFASVELNTELVEQRMRELAWLHPLLEIKWQGQVLPGRGGVRQWARELSASDHVFATQAILERAHIDLAIAWSERREPQVHAFVTANRTPRGTHISGMWRGLAHAAATIGLGPRGKALRARLEPGLVAICNVALFDPRFGGPTRDQLLSPVAGRAVRAAIVQAPPREAAILRELLRGRIG